MDINNIYMAEKMDTNQKYPWLRYGLSLQSNQKVSTTRYVLYITQIAVVIVLSYLSVVLLGPLSYSGISLFYFVTPFFIMFTMWWGIWGILGAYIGCVIGAGLMVGLGVVPSLLYSVADLLTALPVFLIYRGILSRRGIDPLFRDLVNREVEGVKTKRHEAWFWFILIPTVLVNVLGAQVGVGIEYWLGLIPPSLYWYWWWGWVASGVFPMLIFTPILVKGLSEIIIRSNLVNEGWLT
ncbi:MAG: hypothetical protein QW837_06785 [Conexivisphaerales archaeon]